MSFSPTSFMEPWMVGPTEYSLLGSNYFEGYLNCSNSIGSKVTNPVSVELFDFECSDKKDNFDPAAAVSLNFVDPSPQNFFYEIDIIESNIGSDEGVFVFPLEPSTGEIKFCTRVSTWEGSVQIAFRETRFTFGYNLSNNTFTLDPVSIEDAEADAFDTEVALPSGIVACQCSNFACISSTPISQNSMIEICLEPTDSTSRISNFNINIDAGTDFSYDPVEFGTDGWVTTNSATSVSPDTSSDKIMIVTPVVARFFIEDYEEINVSGSAFLEFKETKEYSANFETYGMSIGLIQETSGMGCLMRLFDRIGFFF